MTVVLAIAVVVLAAGLVYALVIRRDEPIEQPDFEAAVRDAAAQVGAQMRDEFVQFNNEARKVDATTAEAALARREAEFRRLTEPMGENLKRIEREVATMSRERKASDGAVRTLLDEMKVGLGDLGSQTGTLVKALRQPKTRGEWGEVQLKRCVEIAGMTEHVDFEVQTTLHGDEGLLRPDAIVRLPAERRVVIDSKVPLDAYLEVLEAEDETSRKAELLRHARQVRDHITKLASKRYQDQFDSGDTPDFVVCFMPSEAALHAAFEAEPKVYDYALEQSILIATPTTLVGLLRTVELGWRQERIAAEAKQIASAANDLYGRMGVFLRHMSKSGRQLSSAVNAYNDAVASAESRVLPQMRRFQELGAASDEDLESPKPIDQSVRTVVAEELEQLEASAETEDSVVELPSRTGTGAA
ncbi:MAG TPA: DNA recombination protein RmuC [Solirubrobacterales bacterium]|nr:DNA recombination protein RmuC [Solirubrobacterales bacterium]